MPSFYGDTLPSQMPLTPPDYYESFSSHDRGVNQLPALRLESLDTQASNYEARRGEDRDLLPRYSQYNLAQPPRQAFPQEANRHAPPSYSTTQGSSNVYNAGGAPLLPPIRVPDRSLEDYQQHVRAKRAPTVTQPKEEKPMGGVAAHLDYDMEDMVDFVSQHAQGIVMNSKASMHPDFRKYVSQVLSSTRLPSSTILLGLYYLSTRMTLLSANGSFNYGGGQVYRMLTIALLLGSKFLDDNTFQNRSWSEVSNIPVSELNVLEVEWLVAIDWNMHIDPEDMEGFGGWVNEWKATKRSKETDQSLVQSLKQTHLTGNNAQRQRSLHQLPSPTDRLLHSHPERPTIDTGFQNLPQSRWNTPRYDPWQSRAHTDYSPPSAPETGPNTPEWYGSHSGFEYGLGPHQAYPVLKIPPPLQVLGSNAPQPGYHTSYAQQYHPYPHGNACGCGYCMPYHDRYLMAPGYGPQSVAG